MISNSNPIKKTSADEENSNLMNEELNFFTNESNLLLKCINTNTYCISFSEYIKKIFYLNQIDFHKSYVQIIYCFNFNEINEMARVRRCKII